MHDALSVGSGGPVEFNRAECPLVEIDHSGRVAHGQVRGQRLESFGDGVGLLCGSSVMGLSCFAILASWFFFFNDTATTEIYTLSLHDALPISWSCRRGPGRQDQ